MVFGYVVGGVAVSLALVGLAAAIGLRRPPLTSVAEGQVPEYLRPAMAATAGITPHQMSGYLFEDHVLGAVLDLSRRGRLRLEAADHGMTVAVTQAARDPLTPHEAVIVDTVAAQPDGRCSLRELMRFSRRPIRQAVLAEYWQNGWLRRPERSTWLMVAALIAGVIVLVETIPVAASGEPSAGTLGRGGAALVAAAAVIAIAAAWQYILATDGHDVTRKGLRAHNDLDRLQNYLEQQTGSALRGDPPALRQLRARLPWVVAFGLITTSRAAGRTSALLDQLIDDSEEPEEPEAGEAEPDLEEIEQLLSCVDSVAAIREVCGDGARSDDAGKDDQPLKESTDSSHDWSGSDGIDHDWGGYHSE